MDTLYIAPQRQPLRNARQVVILSDCCKTKTCPAGVLCAACRILFLILAIAKLKLDKPTSSDSAPGYLGLQPVQGSRVSFPPPIKWYSPSLLPRTTRLRLTLNTDFPPSVSLLSAPKLHWLGADNHQSRHVQNQSSACRVNSSRFFCALKPHAECLEVTFTPGRVHLPLSGACLMGAGLIGGAGWLQSAAT